VTTIVSQSNAKAYMIVHKETERLVGIVSLINMDYKNRSAECIIDIGAKDMWGKGIGSSAISLILEFAFLELNLHRVYLQVFSFNKKAIKLYEKMGFTHEGNQRQALYRMGTWHDIIMMSILENEYIS
ncbi:MAG: GNAT family N-acetyltransferase, partial [Tetragenococcus koreensis]|nr:GNAT family N-acetyltransferase [Tetragenococcus koreensis]